MSRFYFIANNLALDLANTLAVDNDGRDVDLITSFEDLIEWAQEAAIINRKEAIEALKYVNNPAASSALKKAVELRDALKTIAAALANGKVVPNTAVEEINSVLAGKDGYFEIVKTSEGFESKLNIGYRDIRDLTFPVAESAMRLLCYDDPSLVKKCANPKCALYFYDISKRHGRKWCSMSACGNRAKAAAFYEKNRLNDE